METLKLNNRVVIATSVLLLFLSFWRAAAIVLNDPDPAVFYAGGIAEEFAGKAAPWVLLGALLFSPVVRAFYIESPSRCRRGGVYRFRNDQANTQKKGNRLHKKTVY
jgi:hypothetical protein